MGGCFHPPISPLDFVYFLSISYLFAHHTFVKPSFNYQNFMLFFYIFNIK